MSEDDNGEVILPFDEEDDDAMAELFSFGASTSPKAEEVKVDYSDVLASGMPLPSDDGSVHSEDSFLEMLEQQRYITVVDASAVKRKEKTEENGEDENEGMDLQEMLDWLDEDDERQKNDEKEELVFVQPPKPPSPENSALLKPSTPPPPEFDTLEQAVKSSKSSITQIRDLLEKERYVVTSSARPHLWCRVVCGKTLEEISQSSVADSFQQWEQHWHQEKQSTDKQQLRQLQWIQKESAVLADRIAIVCKGDRDLCQQALSSILINHYITCKKHSDDDGDYWDLIDPLLPPVACAILSAGVPKNVAAVMLSHIVPHFMPILALTIKEREEAAFILHRQFYLLACYHLPLLVLHLDRYLPDWYKWPPIGYLPQSYLISHLAGECGGAFMNPRWLQCLWDLILSSSNNSLRFFLVMSILEQNADQLLILTGQQLKDELQKVVAFKQDTADDSFAIEAEDETTTKQATRWVHDWADKAQAIWEETPKSVVRMLKHLEDEAVKEALTRRQEEAEERLRLKLEAQARAHQEALEAEQERKADEARLRLTRARLVAFYRQRNPGKENNIDKIMKTYEGRYDVLDAKLKQKYGVGFNPASKPKPAPNKNSKNVNQGFGSRRQQLFGTKSKDDGLGASDRPKEVVVKTAPSEVLPVVCSSKERNEAKFSKTKKATKVEQTDDRRIPLKFYLVDSRPEAAAKDQGRFANSVNISPDIFMDPDRLKKLEDKFESLRGSVHIVIMGEGYSALPKLYGHKMTSGLAECIKEDETRNKNCGLFFLKKGFPFVSTLIGGFAQAHAWLCRAGPQKNLSPRNVLTSYNPEVSLCGQFETLHNASGREKAQRALQNLFDSSMTALTKNAVRFESLASEVGTGDNQPRRKQNAGQNMVTRFFGVSDQSNKQEAVKSAGEQSGIGESSQAPSAPTFLNPFVRKPQSVNETPQKVARSNSQEPSNTLEEEYVDFDKPDKELPKATCDQSIGSAPAMQRQQPVEPKVNPFSGLLNNSKKPSQVASDTGSSNMNANGLPRNPFVRFGMSSIGKAQREKKGVGMANRFSGLNQLRKNTVARMRSGTIDPVEESKSDTNNIATVDETVSFDQPSPTAFSSPTENQPTRSGDDAGMEESASLNQSFPDIAPSASESKQSLEVPDVVQELVPSKKDSPEAAAASSPSDEADTNRRDLLIDKSAPLNQSTKPVSPFAGDSNNKQIEFDQTQTAGASREDDGFLSDVSLSSENAAKEDITLPDPSSDENCLHC